MMQKASLWVTFVLPWPPSRAVGTHKRRDPKVEYDAFYHLGRGSIIAKKGVKNNSKNPLTDVEKLPFSF